MKIFFILILTLSFRSFALEVDEKLTVRVIRTSESRKTVMINRGVEDALAEGDHAKFIVTAGIVARGVCVKVSPTRSIWSIYRLVNADFMLNDSVMTLKITPAVKMTKDESKSLVEEDTPSSVGVGDVTELGIPLGEGADDLKKEGELTQDADLAALQSEIPSIIPEKNKEVFSLINLSFLSATTKTSTNSATFSHSQKNYHIGFGGEYYPQNERQWYSRFSLLGTVNLMKLDNQAYNGSASTNDLLEFSFGTNWHLTNLPSMTMALIPFIHLSFNMGTVKSTYSSGSESNGATNDLSSAGTTSGLSVGFGYKYYTAKGFGARILLDYYRRSENYSEDEQTQKFNKVVTGPRLMMGIGYRF